MKEEKKILPPRWAARFLHWYCKPELVEDLEGDLNEYFQRNVKNQNARRAKLIYVIDVFKFFRLYTIRKPEFVNLLINWIMIGSYIKTSGRNIARNKLFSTINIVGLSISMSVGLVLISLLSDMFSYDRFHEKGNRIYRVISKYMYLDQEDQNYYASTSPRAGREIKENITGIEDIALLHNGFGGDMKFGDKTVPLHGIFANESFFSIFSFSLLQGSSSNALKEPFSVMLTQTAAKKLFGNEDVMGKVIKGYGDNLFTITGVVEDPPKFSHLRFEMIASISTREVIEKERWDEEMKWDNIWQGYTYLLLPEKSDQENLLANLKALCEKNDKTVKNTKIKLALQPLNEIALGDDLNNSIGPVMTKSEVWAIGILSVVVILSACFNYTNLSLARATKRSKEVGIRKIIGAMRMHVMGQFIVEAVLISVLALFLSFVLFMFLKPYFLSLQPKMQEMLNLDLSSKVVLYFLVLAIVVGFIAGFLPALLYSKINALQVIKSASTLRIFRNVSLRKVLIVVQYSISLAFIAFTIIGLKQYRYLLSYDLGYNTDNVLNIELQGNKPDLLIKELKEMPEVENVSRSLLITSVGNYWGTRMKYQDPHDSASIHYNTIDENYIPLHNVKLIAGRNFTPLPDSVNESEVIVNTEILKRFNITNQDPQKAINELVTVDRKKMKIVGVVSNFHYGKADGNSSEMIFRYLKRKPNWVNVKINTKDWPATLSKIENSWKKLDNVHPLQAQLYKDKIAYSYREIAAMLKMMGFLGFLAICIASLGLLGMVIFITEIRLKEVSVRKVLGASEAALIYLLGKGFLFLLIIAGVIALPATYLFIDRIFFTEMQNHIAISLFDLTIGFFGVMAFALLLIGTQTLKAARSNPSEILKNE